MLGSHDADSWLLTTEALRERRALPPPCHGRGLLLPIPITLGCAQKAEPLLSQQFGRVLLAACRLG